MTDQSIGTARLDIVVNTDGMTTGVDAAIRKTREYDAAAKQSAQTQEQTSKRAQDATRRAIDQFGKSRDEVLKLQVAQRFTGEEAARLTAKIDAQAAALKRNGAVLNQYGVSAKQQAAALRGVPAQVTDIVTSLASGQRPLSVLLQQGGQLKDMFGGIVPAARALGGAVLGLINPFTLAIGAVVGLGAAWNKAEGESAAFNRAIALTGNIANQTEGDLQGLAAQLDGLSGVTRGAAADAVAQVAQTGKFTAEQIALVSKAALQMQDATGRAIDQTVKDFASLKDGPVDAILKLNDAMGDGTNVTQFLTQETLRQIESLDEQGKHAQATQVAFEAYASAINQRTPQVTQNLSEMQGLWRDIKIAASEATDSVVDFFRNSRTSEIAALAARSLAGPLLPEREAPKPIFFGFKNSAPKPIDTREEKEAIQFKDRYLTREENKKKAIAELDRLRSHYTKDEYDILKKGIEERFKPPKGRKPGSDGIESATSKAAIQAFEDQLKKEQGLLANQKQVLEANYSARNILAADYYREQKRLAQENTAAQEQALEGEIAALKSRSLKGKDSINNTRELAEKEALLAKVRADGASALEVLNIQEAAQLKQRQQANIAYQDALDQGKEALKAELDSQVLRISVGEREFEIRSRIIQLYREEAKELLNLARQRDAGEIDEATFQQRSEQLKKAIGDEVKIVRDGYDAMADAQKDWSNGAIKAFADYRDAANDVAGQTYGIFTDSIKGLEDVLTDFFTKGKADWKGFFDNIAAEITRFAIRQQLSRIIKKFVPGMDDESGGGNAQALSSAAGQLAASAAPLYGAAAALSASAAALAAAGVGSAASGNTGNSSGGGLASLLPIFASMVASADGNVFKGGNVVPFARGGVVSSPTIFPMRTGMGLMGEAGPEAIMPLKRGPDGKLGVVAEVGHSGGAVTVVQNINVQGQVDQRTRNQLRADSASNQNRALARNR